MKRGTKEWGEYQANETVLGFGRQITEHIVCVREASVKNKKGNDRSWYLELLDTRTGKGVEVYFSPMGNKVTATLTGESK